MSKTESKKPGKPKLLIVDGHALAFRAFYAFQQQNLTDSKGNPTETVFGFYRMIGKLLSDINPEHFLLVFDTPGKTFRADLYPEYKANRSETPEPFRIQMKQILDISKILDLSVLFKDKFEADDIIATICTKHGQGKIDISIVSGDKDLFSLLTNNVTMLRPTKGVSEFKLFTPEIVTKELNVKVSQIIDYMALTGDTSDNIPGVKGIGPKMASKLLNEFTDLKNIYENISDMKPGSVKDKLLNSKNDAFMSLELVTLKKDVDVSFEIDDSIWRNKKEMKDNITIFQELELPTLYKQWQNLFGENSEKANITSDAFLKNTTLITNKNEWNQLYATLKNAQTISLDTETTSTDAMIAELIGVSMSWLDKGDLCSMYIPIVFDSTHDRHFDYQNIIDPKEALTWVRPILEDETIKKIGQNVKYDKIVLENHGVKVKGYEFDTMLLSYLINPNVRRHNLDNLAFQHLSYETIKYSDIVGSGRKKLELVQVPIDELAKYAAEDAEVTFRLKEELEPIVTKEGLMSLYRDIDFPLMNVLTTIEQNGFIIDKKYLNTLQSKYKEKLTIIENSIYELAGEEFNINSTKEMQVILFENLNIQSTKKTAKGSKSTEASVLESIKDQHPIIEEILKYRTLAKLLSTYIETLPNYINPKTGRVHTSLSQAVAATGRLASSDPNLQNIPIKGNDGNAIRKAFVPEKNNFLLSLDYSQIELRVIAHYSNDKHLINAFLNDEDIHDQATYLLFGQNETDDSKVDSENIEGAFIITEEKMKTLKASPGFSEKRSQAKILNFSIVYGVTEYGLSKNLGISIPEARLFMEAYFKSYPGIKNYMENIIETTKEKGYSENLFGRKRKVDNINHSNRFLREAAERLAINNPIQSTAADLIKVAMINIQKKIESNNLKSKMILQVHDELLFEVPKDEKEKLFELVKYEMENAIKLIVPLKVSGGFAKNWQEAK